jgi:hypothetical protein
MSAFITNARAAIIKAIKEDDDIASRVRTWYTFDTPLAQRFTIEPVECPALAVYPGRLLEPEERFNAAFQCAQEIIILIATDGQQPDACEELVAYVWDRIRACRDTALDMASEGLKNIRATIAMEAVENEKAARIQWQATITVTLEWIRF